MHAYPQFLTGPDPLGRTCRADSQAGCLWISVGLHVFGLVMLNVVAPYVESVSAGMLSDRLKLPPKLPTVTGREVPA